MSNQVSGQFSVDSSEENGTLFTNDQQSTVSVTFTASGTWNTGSGSRIDYGPEGKSGAKSKNAQYPDNTLYALLAVNSNNEVVGEGASMTLTLEANECVSFKVNDTHYANNSGQLTVDWQANALAEDAADLVTDTHIVRAAIHPGIGVARIGNSTEAGEAGYYIGPEVIEPALMSASEMRDASGAIKRQAARFRIYGYNAAGQVVKEIKADDANIEWTVHLANKKSQWYRFKFPLDVPEAKGFSLPRRNKEVKGSDRDGLAIDPGPRTITGQNSSGPTYQFDGTFVDESESESESVRLGEICTDSAGRLLVLGGLGQSGSPKGKPIYDPDDGDSFVNADGWYDDISDGPVTATVSLKGDGRQIEVDPSWVIVGPPNYAPNTISWNTLYDLLLDSYVRCGRLPFPQTVSFTKDVLPLLCRLSNLQWVNKGFAAMFGHGAPMNFEDPAFIAKLAFKPATDADPDPYAELRQVVHNAFRPPTKEVNEPRLWPWIYGDLIFEEKKFSPRQNLAMLDVHAKLFKRWVEGDFVNDWDPKAEPPRIIDQVALQERPAMLDQAALHFCLADAFHPGCEITWPMRHATMYSKPFRIRHRPPGEPEPDYGDQLTQRIVLQPDGPLYAQGPGDITRWMGLPWQGDTAHCRSGYDPDYDPYLPTFWPAGVPNQVLTEEDYAKVISDISREERIAAFNNREFWWRALDDSTTSAAMEQMVAEFGQMGIVEARPGIKDDPDFPDIMMVESLPAERAEQLKAKRLADIQSGKRSRRRSRLEQAGWESAEQLEAFRRIRMRR